MKVDIQLGIQFALAFVFFLSTAHKLRNPKSFARGVVEYKILPQAGAYAFGFVIIALEGWLALTHLTGWSLGIAAGLGVGLLATFMIAVGINLARGRNLPCYCFGNGARETISMETVARLLLLLVGEVLLLSHHGLFAADRLVFTERLSDVHLAFFWATLLIVVGLWLSSFADLMTLFRLWRT